MKVSELIHLLQEHAQPEDDVQLGYYDHEYCQMVWEPVTEVLPTGQHEPDDPQQFVGLVNSFSLSVFTGFQYRKG